VAGVDSLVWVEGDGSTERVLVRSDAAFAVARYLGGPWAVMAAVGGVIPRPIRDAAYDVVARNRKRFGGPEVCLMVAAEIRGRELP
jgi:predicted DCC family thiol-disulfide oxidoreductase YuxK